VKCIFAVGIALTIARGVIGLIDPTALNAPIPPPPPEPAKGHAAVVADGPTGTISGSICDAKTGDVLIGAIVVVAGTERGAPTDINGEYVITSVLPGTYDLHASCTGYRDCSVPVTLDSLTGLRADFRLVGAPRTVWFD